MSIGQNIKNRREQMGITQIELSEKVGITQSMLCKIERDLNPPSFPTVVLIAEALNCTTDALAK